MSPTTKPRFIFVLSEEERAMLDALAEAENRTAANWLCTAIRQAYRAKFGDKRPKRRKKR